jgi:hypothetical protein
MGETTPVDAARSRASSHGDSYSDLFDERPTDLPDGALYARPSLFKRVCAWFSEVFTGWAEGMKSAWSAVKHAFGSKDAAGQALLNIKQPMSDGIPPVTADIAPGVASQSVPDKTAAASIDGAAPVDSLAPIAAPASGPAEPDDEQAFSLFVAEFKQARRDGTEFSGAGRQQFDDAARRHAQKLYGTEVARLDALGDRPGDYALGSDEALAIEVASALLRKPLPHQKLLDLTGQAAVPAYSARDQENFDAWLEWRETKVLPGGQAIDLASAARYANEYIAKNTPGLDESTSPAIVKRLEQANELVGFREDDARGMKVEVDLRNIEESVAALRPVPLPPFPKGVTTLALHPINGGLNGASVKSMIRGSRTYLEAIRNGEALKPMSEERAEKFEGDKAHAITFASLWAAGKSDPHTLQQIQGWDFFGTLDQLLDLDKIKNDFK